MSERIFRGKSLTEKCNTYTVIDVETTGYFPGYDEIIEFAGLKVRDGVVVDSYQTLIKPTDEIDEFITDLTGITNEMLEDAPSIEEVIDSIEAFIADDIIVGHNASFDVNFVYDTLLESREYYLKNDFLDTLRLSRKLFKDLPNHQLSTLAHEFNKENFPSHRAMNDCLATQELLQYIYKYLDDNGFDLPTLFKRVYNPNKKKLDVNLIEANTDDIDEDNPLYGQAVCFTGTLDKMLRKDALQLVANLGGKPMDSVTKETNLLVLGDIDYKNSKGDKKSNKYKKAESLILKGADLKIISETAFLDMIDDEMEKKYYR